MSEGSCGECGTAGCCCQEITRIRGGIHPDEMVPVCRILQANKMYQLVNTCCHLFTASVFPVKIAADKRFAVRFFSNLAVEDGADLDPETDSTKFILGGTTATTEPIIADENYFGVEFDGGVYVEVLCDDDTSSNTQVAVNLLVVDRDFFSPAYQRSEETAIQYWTCWRNDGFLDNWRAGEDSIVWELDEGGGDGKGVLDAWRHDREPDMSTRSGELKKQYSPYLEFEDDGGDGSGGSITYNVMETETDGSFLSINDGRIIT